MIKEIVVAASFFFGGVCLPHDFQKISQMQVSVREHTVAPNNFWGAIFFAIGSYFHQFFTASDQLTVPSHKWDMHQWEKFLHQRFPNLDKNNFAQHVIGFYEGYHYKGFRDFIIYLDCPEHYFDALNSLTDLSRENFGYIHPYLETLGIKRDTYLAFVHQTLQQRAGLYNARFRLQRQPEIIVTAQPFASSGVSVADCPREFKDIPVEIRQERIEAFHCIADMKTKTMLYVLSSPAERLLMVQGMNPEAFKQFRGFSLQHAAHKETIKVLETVAKQTISQGAMNTVLAFMLYSHEANKQGDLAKTYRALNVCWSVLNGIAKGVYATGHGLVNSVIHPVEMLKNIKSTLWHIKQFLGQHVTIRTLDILDGDDQPVTAIETDAGAV